jgi:hypothetical protein
MADEFISNISESVNEEVSPQKTKRMNFLELEMFASTAEKVNKRELLKKRTEERKQRALNIHRRNMLISYHSPSSNTAANSSLA